MYYTREIVAFRKTFWWT